MTERWKDGRFKTAAKKFKKQEAIMSIEFFWVPEVEAHVGFARTCIVEMPREPKRIQTVLPHRQYDIMTGAFIREVNSRDPNVVPVMRERRPGEAELYLLHNSEVFYEDRVHDWQWEPARDGKPAHLRYYSRAVHDGRVWIRCEFED